VVVSDASLELYREVKNLVISNRVLPVEGYEFPQAEVAEFWKEVFIARGIRVYGYQEVPADVKVIQADFILPDDPPSWLVEEK
jgi:hypothetical protein